jgi:hypothetical protein
MPAGALYSNVLVERACSGSPGRRASMAGSTPKQARWQSSMRRGAPVPTVSLRRRTARCSLLPLPAIISARSISGRRLGRQRELWGAESGADKPFVLNGTGMRRRESIAPGGHRGCFRDCLFHNAPDVYCHAASLPPRSSPLTGTRGRALAPSKRLSLASASAAAFPRPRSLRRAFPSAG